MRELSFDEFRDREGDSFELLLDDKAIPFVLDRAEELPPTARQGGAFTLDWSGPFEPVLPQAIYTFRDGDRQFEMFIVPIKQDRDRAYYEAVFN